MTVVLPGRFHPFHSGHASTWRWLANQFGACNVYVAPSKKLDPSTAPFDIGQRIQQIQTLGVPACQIMPVTNGYRIRELLDLLGDDQRVLILAVSDKDTDRVQRLLDNEYYLPWQGADQARPVSDTGQAYVMTTPVFEFMLAGQIMSSATQVRECFAQANQDQRSRMLLELYGRYGNTARLKAFERTLDQKITVPCT